MAKPAHQFEIVFKSGHVRHIYADGLTTTRNKQSDEVVALEWDNMRPQNMTIILSQIESIWQVD